MEKELSDEAISLLQYIVKNKDAFNDYFNASNICHRKGHVKVDVIKPLLKELTKAKALKSAKEFFKSPRYKLNLNIAESILGEPSKEETVYTQEYREALEDEIKKYKKFVVTTAVMGKDINKPFVEAIRNYARRNEALMLILPCEDVASRGKKANYLDISPDLRDFRVVFKDTYLNNNLCLSAIRVSAKQIQPLSGLDRITTSRNASIIVASPKVFLKYVPNMHYDIPLALMTTGAITENNYDNDMYMSKRTSMLAENDHTYGAVIIEIEDENIFHFRHVQASTYNSITDLGLDYLPDGSQKVMEDTVMIMGDSHIGYHDEELYDSVMDLAQDINVKEIVLHDIFHGSSVSHHDANKGVTNSIKAQEGRIGLELECEAVKNYLKSIVNCGMNVVVVDSNHDRHLLRFLEEGRFRNDPINYKFSLKLALAATENKNPLRYAIENLLDYSSDKVRWLEPDESFKVYGVECGVHGDRGPNGSRGSLNSYDKSLGNCVTAHSHSAAIIRKAFCVGTVGQMDMKYNRGLSSWTRTCCLIYSNGSKQLVNFIPNKKGDYTCEI